MTICKNFDNKKSFNVLLVSKGMYKEKFLSELLREMGISYAVLVGPHLRIRSSYKIYYCFTKCRSLPSTGKIPPKPEFFE